MSVREGEKKTECVPEYAIVEAILFGVAQRDRPHLGEGVKILVMARRERAVSSTTGVDPRYRSSFQIPRACSCRRRSNIPEYPLEHWFHVGVILTVHSSGRCICLARAEGARYRKARIFLAGRSSQPG